MIHFLKDLSPNGKKVFVRVDYNVPVSKGVIQNDLRIRESLKTIKYLLDNGAKQVILASHLGRPKGEGYEAEFSLAVIVKRLEELLGEKVYFVKDCIDVFLPTDAKVVLLENLRFHKEEESNDEVFGKKLSSVADVYVNDAFGTCHRAHASVHAITHYLHSYAGFLVEKELKCLDLSDAQRPVIAIFGFAKLSDKIMVMKNLSPRVDRILLGGAVIFTFLKSLGFEVGKSLMSEKDLGLAKEMLNDSKIILPVDVVVAYDKNSVETRVVDIDKIPKDMAGFDIGPKTVEMYKRVLAGAKTVIWNGPVGLFEVEPYAKATSELADYITSLPDCRSVVGGGDTASAIEKLGFYDKFTHVSTGGGASLEFFEGKKLPALVALSENDKIINNG